MNQKFDLVFCEEGCGRKTRDYFSICSKCSSGSFKREQSKGYLGIEELQRRESLDDVYRNMNTGWPYSDNGG